MTGPRASRTRLLASLAALGAVLASGYADEARAQPTYWLTAGGHVALETGRLSGTLDPEGAGLVGAGWHLLRLGLVLLAPEVEGTAGRVTARVGIVGDRVLPWRVRVGGRVTWWEEHDEPYLVLYLRAGGVYRQDRSGLVRDDGVGWYAGVGVDWRVSDAWSLGPFATYEEVGLSVGTKTWLFGLGLTYGF